MAKKKKNNRFIKYWRGEESLVFSFWVVLTLGLGALSIPLIYMSSKGDAWVDTLSTGPVLFLILYVIFFYSTAVYVYVGLWRSASKYIELKKKKKLSALWGYVTYVWMVLAIIRMIREFFR